MDNKKFRWLRKMLTITGLLSIFNFIEGVSHLLFSVISIWGAVDLSVYDWRVLLNPISDLVMGVFSIATSIFLGKGAKRK